MAVDIKKITDKIKKGLPCPPKSLIGLLVVYNNNSAPEKIKSADNATVNAESGGWYTGNFYALIKSGELYFVEEETSPNDPILEYDTVLDSKNRVTVRKGTALYKNYHVRIFSDGKIVLEPRILVEPDRAISKRTLQAMDKAMLNLKKGRASKPINLKRLKKQYEI